MTQYQLLLKLNFNVNSKGLEYWIKAIEIYKKNKYKSTFNMMILYEVVGSYFNTTGSRVERALRHSRLNATKNIQTYYKYNGKITNKTVLELMSPYYGSNIENIYFDEFIMK